MGPPVRIVYKKIIFYHTRVFHLDVSRDETEVWPIGQQRRQEGQMGGRARYRLLQGLGGPSGGVRKTIEHIVGAAFTPRHQGFVSVFF
jgi:hypothetical protein